MLRRTILLALAGLAIAAPPALAKSHWNSRMMDANATSSRTADGCSITNGSRHGSLVVSCASGDQATLTYAFPLGAKHIKGNPWCGVSLAWGWAQVHRSCRVSGGTLRVTVTVADGQVVLSTVNVGYYT